MKNIRGGEAMPIRGESQAKKMYYKGETVFTEGEGGNHAFIIETGAIELFKTVEGEKLSLAVLHSGALFGEMAIIDNSPRMASARATEDSILLSITHSMLEAKLKKNDKFTRGLIRVLINNLRNVHKAYMRRPRSIDDYLYAVDFHLSGLGDYMEKPDAESVSAETIKHLETINATIARMKSILNAHKDKRKSVLEKSDLTSTGKPD